MHEGKGSSVHSWENHLEMNRTHMSGTLSEFPFVSLGQISKEGEPHNNDNDHHAKRITKQ